MKTDVFALRGNIIYSSGPKTALSFPNHFAVCENGVCAGVFPELPESFRGVRTDDFGEAPVIPGYVDLHLHAPQYPNLGLGMDLELLDWLSRYTFPEEAGYASVPYAERVYERFVRELRGGMTTRACVFGTVHAEATALLMEKLEKSGLCTMVGKVNMDRNCPEALREKDAKASIDDTIMWLERISGKFKNTKPVITPRFAPGCSAELLGGLGGLAKRFGLPVQSHLSENRSEIELVKRLYPECPGYAAVYEKYGLLGAETVMAHCVYLTEDEQALLRDTGTLVAHCPTSNCNLRSGMAPVGRYLDMGIRVGLGSDISGGHTLDMSEVMRAAISVSKLLWTAENGQRPLSSAEAFYLATRGGGAFFGKVGAFEPGFEFDAVVLDGPGTGPGKNRAESFEKLIYLASGRNVRAKYVRGERIF